MTRLDIASLMSALVLLLGPTSPSWSSVPILGGVHSFVLMAPHTETWSTATSTLSATQKKNKKKKRPSSNVARTSGGGGFGGAAMEQCPCGSGDPYSGCCGRLHQDGNAYRVATAEQVVRARYSAYAKKQAEFLMASTHPMNKAFDTDSKRWKETIRTNMYDNFDMPRCLIVEEKYDASVDTKATVKFIAEMILRETGEITSFMETSAFERAKTHGAWLYLDGTIEAAPGETTTDGNDGDQSRTINEKLASLL